MATQVLQSGYTAWVLVFAAALCDSYAAFIVKLKFNELGKMDLSSWGSFFAYMLTFIKSPLLMTALTTFVAAPGLWFLALNRLELSSAYPVRVRLHLLFVLLFGVGLLGKQLSTTKMIGTGLIFFAMYLFNR